MSRAARSKTPHLTHDPHLRMALEAAGMVTWEWDVPVGIIRYSDNVSDLAAGDNTGPYSTLDGLMQQLHPDDRTALGAGPGHPRGTPASPLSELHVTNVDW